jgi:hypothetical protein
MRKFYDQDAEWETFSLSASLKPAETDADDANSPRAVLGEIGMVLAGALAAAAVIDVALMLLHVRPFV